MSETQTFASLGKQQAISLLFEATPYKAFEEPLFFQAKARSYVHNVSKLFLEGIDFDLTYFPLKHLGYKSVIAATAVILSALHSFTTATNCSLSIFIFWRP